MIAKVKVSLIKTTEFLRMWGTKWIVKKREAL